MFAEVEFFLPNPSQSELLSALLTDFGFEGIEELPNSLKAYISEKQFDQKALEEFLNQFPALDKITFTQKLLPDKNWNEAWEKSYEPVIVSDKVRIRAFFHLADKKFIYDILIDPQMSFGTGHHESTQLMTEMMLDMDFRNKSVLDFGCGTGVLSILAHKMGGENVIAVDIDEWAYKNIVENIKKNNASGIQPLHGNASVIANKSFEIVLANVNKNIIAENMELLAFRLPKNGIILFSGLLKNDEQDMVKAALNNGLILQEKKTKNEWICLKMVKQ